MSLQEIMPLFVRGSRIRVTDWPSNDFIFRMPNSVSEIPDWLRAMNMDKVLELNERSIYDESLNEVGAVTLVENFDMEWEFYNGYVEEEDCE